MIGSKVYATSQGLGVLAKAFYDNGVIDLVSVKTHTSRHNYYGWYPDAVTDEELLDKCTTLLFFETPFDWKLIVKARERGIKTVLMVMFECSASPLPYQPDLILAPSALDLQYYQEGKGVVVPVDVPWKLRSKALVFVHNGGNGGLGGRNGTKELLDAMKYVKSPIKLIIRSQVPINQIDDPRIEYRIGNFDYNTLYDEGDVFVFPEKFNGLSLPMQEAFASGMVVMCGARFPMTEWLPIEPMFKVDHYSKQKIAVEFDCAHYDPKDIAEKIDSFYNTDIEKYSLMGKEWAEQNSWKVWKDKYIKLCQ